MTPACHVLEKLILPLKHTWHEETLIGGPYAHVIAHNVRVQHACVMLAS